jgi:hypothetical protein
MDFRVSETKWRRDRNGGASTADGYARSDRITGTQCRARSRILGILTLAQM